MTVNSLVTNNDQPLLSGTVSSLSPAVGIAQVEVLVGNQTLFATVTGNVWDVVPAALPDGIYNVEAIATDVAGNTTIDNAANVLTVDTTPPIVAVNTLVTNNNKPTLSGTAVDPSPGSGVASVSVTVAGRTIPATLSGNAWTATVPVALADGTYTVTATSKDNAGNTGTSTGTNQLVVDTVPPQVTVAALTVNTNQPVLHGTVTDAAPSSGIVGVTLVVGGQTFAATVAGATWGVTVPAPLADGTYDVTATATDNAGNSTTITAAHALIVDTVPPVVTVNPLVTNNNKPTLSGTVADPAPSSGLASVSVSVGGENFPAVVTGNTWTVAVTVALPDGAYNLVATATDKAGNSATNAAATQLVVDTVKPVVTVATLVTNDDTPTLTGTVTDPAPSSGIAGVTVVVAGQTLAATVTGATWTAVVPVALADGAYTVQATATDDAGNVSLTSTGPLTVDTVSPVVAVAPLVTKNNTPTLGGTVTDAAPSSGIAGVTVLVGGQTLTATVNGTSWTAAVPVALADGTYTVQAAATDNAGNVSLTATAPLTVDTVSPVVTVTLLVTNNNKPTLSGTVVDPRPQAASPG